MTRIVDVDKLKKKIEEVQYTQEFCVEHQIDYSISMQMLGMVIDNAPTVEPQMTELEEHFYHRCGFLQGMEYGKEIAITQDNEEGMYSLGRYCHHCGADMREADNE